MMRNSNVIYIKDEQDKIRASFRLRRKIKEAVNKALEMEAVEPHKEVSVTLTDDEKIHALNLQYRNVDRPTDVLSFPLDEDGEAELGDIVISLERAQAQADEYGHSLEHEVMFLCVHSVLHLLGYDHNDDMKDLTNNIMYNKQRFIMSKLDN